MLDPKELKAEKVMNINQYSAMHVWHVAKFILYSYMYKDF